MAVLPLEQDLGLEAFAELLGVHECALDDEVVLGKELVGPKDLRQVNFMLRFLVAFHARLRVPRDLVRLRLVRPHADRRVRPHIVALAWRDWGQHIKRLYKC